MFSFPTVIFTIPLGIAVLYWASAFLGLADIEMFDGAFDGAIDGAIDGAADAMLDGAADGLADGAADGAEVGLGETFGLSALLLIGTVPVTISFTLLFFWNWLLCMFGSVALSSMLGDSIPAWIWQVLLLLVSLVISLFVTNLSARPLGPLFKTHAAVSKHSFVGEVVEITTGRVDRDFGQAAYEDGGAGMTLQVRCDPQTGLKRGDKAVILSHDPENDSFEVETIEDMVASDLDDDQPTEDEAE
jgi:hypothetical protein